MTLNSIGDMATAAMGEVEPTEDLSRGQMLSRRGNDIPATVIQAQANTPADMAQMFARRNLGNQTEQENS